MPGPIDQDHPMMFGEPLSKRLPHRFEVRTRAVQHHDRRRSILARPDLDDVQARTFDVEIAALRRMRALQGNDAQLRDGGQHRQRRHDNDCKHRDDPDDPSHQPATGLPATGFAAYGGVFHTIQRSVIRMSPVIL
jgi:hypothetical protein